MAENRALLPTPTMYTAEVKDAKDLSKNLVGGDFERQYKKTASWRKNLLIKVSLGVLAVWLLVLTVLREAQLAQLRREVDILTASVNKIVDNRLFNEFQTLEDTIYADEDQDNVIEAGKKDDGSIEKLRDLTVLEDDSTADDEDLFDDDDDEESGDWYMDYDRRQQKAVTTNMVRLKPDDFTDAVLRRDSVSHIREIKRLLNENPEIDSVLSALPSEKPTESPQAEAAAAEPSPPSAPSHRRDRRSFFPDSELAAPNVVSRVDERRKSKKFVSSRDAALRVPTISRTARNSDDEDGRRPFVAAHFHGNTSHLNMEVHEHYKGNGLIRVAHDAAHDVWWPAAWTLASPHARPTLARNGHVHVHHTGVYLVYVQIYYLDNHDVISWVLHRTSPVTQGRETLLQCALSAPSPLRQDRPNSCFSASALFLRAGDRLAVRNTGGERHSIMQPEKSFIGLIKLADADEPDDEM
ncbi:uncharacterized protein LOC121730361 [Aricia agestis]|uniref:uncharacterized protein LOC121730361 n=1 Tax=Aricia agestis TaxID=91739 RepID=UPI001C2030BB|nr:uncharacterized protein LOC121730361 [Aricia agestis]